MISTGNPTSPCLLAAPVHSHERYIQFVAGKASDRQGQHLALALHSHAIARRVFDATAKALGVVFDVSDTKLLEVRVCNLPSLCQEAGENIVDRILSAGKTSKSELEVLRGRLFFADSQICGRLAHAAHRTISQAMYNLSLARLDPGLKRGLI